MAYGSPWGLWGGTAKSQHPILGSFGRMSELLNDLLLYISGQRCEEYEEDLCYPGQNPCHRGSTCIPTVTGPKYVLHCLNIFRFMDLMLKLVQK